MLDPALLDVAAQRDHAVLHLDGNIAGVNIVGVHQLLVEILANAVIRAHVVLRPASAEALPPIAGIAVLTAVTIRLRPLHAFIIAAVPAAQASIAAPAAGLARAIPLIAVAAGAAAAVAHASVIAVRTRARVAGQIAVFTVISGAAAGAKR